MGCSFFNKGVKKLYLNGYEIEKVISQNLPTELSIYAGLGFCYEFSALMMLSLKDNHTSRLVHGFVTAPINGKDEHFPHAWVEYDNDKVIDLYAAHTPIDKDEFYDEMNVEVKFVSEYEDFWQTRTTGELYSCIQTKDTSYIWPILTNFRPHPEPFGFRIKYIPDPDNMDLFGKAMPEYWIIGKDGEKIYIRQELFDQIIAPTKTAP